MRRTPSLFPVLAAIPLLAACSDDPCELLCQSVGRRVGGCLEEWEADWDFFGATRQREFVTTCEDDWNATRVDLEIRQTDAAKDACQDALDQLSSLSCEELRALYF